MNNQYPFQAQPLPYSYIALVPYCDADTLYLHHAQYYAKKVCELNTLVRQHRLEHLTLEEILTRRINLPVVQEERLKSVAGAVYNHQLFFDGITDTPKEPPLNQIVGEVVAKYGTMDRFGKLIAQAAGSLLGAGWVFLTYEKTAGLAIVVTCNCETVALQSVTPLLAVDLWEHSYFLMNQFDREKYVDGWLSLIDWDKAEIRYQKALQSKI